MTPDVVVIGGGPAGLASGIVLARHGIRTCVVERGSWPIDKPCGEGLLPNGLAALARLGIDRRALETKGTPIAGIRYFSRAGRRAGASFTAATGLGVSRKDLSSLLVERARLEPSLELLTARAAVERSDNGRPIVTLGGQRITPRLVIAADGLDSPVRKALGIKTRIGRHRRWGLRQHLDGAAWTDHVEVYFGNGLEAYVTPLRCGLNVAFLWDQEAITVPRGVPAFDYFVAQTPALARKLDGMRACDRVRAAGPFARRLDAVVADGVLFAGDAAGYVDALTGEGVGLALHHAEAIERAVVPVLRSSTSAAVLARSDLEPYAQWMARTSQANAQLTRLLVMCSRYPALTERVVAAMAADPALFHHCLRVNMGERELWRVPLLSAVRLPWSLIFPGDASVAK